MTRPLDPRVVQLSKWETFPRLRFAGVIACMPCGAGETPGKTGGVDVGHHVERRVSQ